MRGKRHIDQLVTRAVEHVSDIVEITDAQGRFQYVNPAFEEKTGFSREEVLGSTPAEILRSDEHSQNHYDEIWATISEGDNWRGRVTSRAKDGSKVIFEVFITPIVDDDGEITHFVAVRRDVTERIEMEARLIRADRLVAIGQLAAGIGHEINNPLGFISSNLQYLRSRVDELAGELAEDFELVFDDIFDGLERIEKIVEDLGSLTRDLEHRKSIDVVEALEASIDLLDNENGETVEFDRDFGDVSDVEANRSALIQVFFNLLLNGAQAMAHEPVSNRILRLTATETDDEVVVEITDRGRGIPKEELDHVFDPFYSTREVDEGRGLGLSICYGVVHELGSDIEVDSEPGEGTVFRVRLPVV